MSLARQLVCKAVTVCVDGSPLVIIIVFLTEIIAQIAQLITVGLQPLLQ